MEFKILHVESDSEAMEPDMEAERPPRWVTGESQQRQLHYRIDLQSLQGKTLLEETETSENRLLLLQTRRHRRTHTHAHTVCVTPTAPGIDLPEDTSLI